MAWAYHLRQTPMLSNPMEYRDHLWGVLHDGVAPPPKPKEVASGKGGTRRHRSSGPPPRSALKEMEALQAQAVALRGETSIQDATVTDFGPNAEVNIKLTVDADEANAAIEAKLAKAIADALKSAEVKAAIEALSKQFFKMGEQLSKDLSDVMKKMTQDSKTLTDAMKKRFEEVAKSARKAFDFNEARGGRSELSALNKSIEAIASSMDDLKSASTQTMRVMEELGRQTRLTADLAARESRDATLAAKAAAGERVAQLQKDTSLARGASNERVAMIRAVSRQIIQIERAIGTVVTGVWRAATSVVSAFARGASAALARFRSTANSTFSGIGRLISAAFSGGVRVVASFARGATSALAGIGRGALSGIRSFFSTFRSLLSRQERDVQASVSRQAKTFSSLTTGGLLGRLALYGGGGAGLISTLTSGFQRFSDVETLQFRFERFLGSAQQASDLIQQLSDFARTTSFDLPGVAGLASNFLAMGQSADQAVLNIERLADVTAFAGGNTESLERIQRALGQIVSTGKLQGDELNQLAENLPGINIRQIIADQLGITTAELVKMQEDGKLSADAFITAFLEGIDDPRYQGAAVAIAGTLSGQFSNLKESFAVFGATIIGLVAGPLGAAMGQVTSFLTTVGDFISGDMFKKGARNNPFANIADDAKVMLNQLPPEAQAILRGEFGFTEENWVSAADAREIWEQFNPPNDVISGLEKFRDILGDVLKVVGVLVGLKLGTEVFQLLGRGALGLFTTVGADGVRSLSFFKLLGLTVIGVAGAISLFTKVSDKFAESWRSATDRFRPMIDSFVRLGKAFRGAFATSDKTGVLGFLERLGDSLAIVGRAVARVFIGFQKFADVLAYWLRVDGFDGFFDNLKRAAGEGIGSIFDLDDPSFSGVFDKIRTGLVNFFDSLDQIIGNTIASVFGFESWGKFFVAEGSGSAILNALELTFLRPIVQFFRGPFLDGIKRAVGAVGGFFGAVFSAIFGRGGSGNGGSGSSQSTATRILNFLEDSFLGPVVRFFRGPFADGVEAAVGGVIGFGQGLFEAVFGDGEGATITRVADFLENTFLAPIVDFFRGGTFDQYLANITTFFSGIGAAISGLWDRIEPIVQPLIDKVTELIDAFKNWDFSNFNLGNILAGAGIGAGIGALVGGLPGLLVGGVIGGLSQTGLFGALVDTINNAWSMEIQPALANLWGNIQSYITDTFTTEQLGKAAHFILDFLYEAGRLAANFATDPVTIGIIAAAVAAVVVAGVNLALGLIAGLGDSILQWSSLIAAALNAAWGSVGQFLDFIPDPISDAIGATVGKALNSPSGGLAFAVGGTALGIKLGQVLVPAVIGGISQVGPALIRGAGGLGAIIFGGTLRGRDKLGIGKNALGESRAFASVGTAIAGAVVGGIASFELGRAAGRSGGIGNVILSLLAGTATGAAIGTAIFPGLGTAIGAALGLAVSGVGAFFGAAGRQADEAKEKALGYAEALREAGRVGATEGLAADFRALDESVRDALIENGFTIDAYYDNIVTKGQTAGEQLAGFLDNALDFSLADAATDAALDSAIEKIRLMGDDIEGLDRREMPRVFTPEEWLALQEGLSAAGISMEDLAESTDFLENNAVALKSALDINSDLEAVAGAAVDAYGAFDDLGGAVDYLANTFRYGHTGEDIATLLNQTGLTTTESIEAISGAIDELKDEADKARESLLEMLNVEGPAAETIDDLARGIRLDIAGGIGDIDLKVNPPDSDQFQQELQGFETSVQQALSDAISAGFITSPEDAASFIQGLREGIEEDETLDEAVRSSLLESLDAFDASSATFDWDAFLDAQEAVTAAERALAEVQGVLSDLHWGNSVRRGLGGWGQSASGGSSGSAGDSIVAGVFGEGVNFQPAVDAGEETVTKYKEGIDNAISTVKAKGSDAAKQAASGISGASGFVSIAGAQLGLAATNAIAGFSNQMYLAGANLAQAMARGIRDQTTATALAAAAMANAVAQAARNALKIKSPSQVFVDIGKQIGQGFVEGIQDSEVSMADALESAITGAITKATEGAGEAIRKAKVGEAIFGALAPSTLPGGTTNASILAQRLSLVSSLGDFTGGLRSGAATRLGGTDRSPLAKANEALYSISLDMQEAMYQLREQFKTARAALEAGTASPTEYNLGYIGTNTLALGSVPGNANRAMLDEALGRVREWANVQLEAGASVNTVTQSMLGYVDAVRKQAVALGLNAAEVSAYINEVGLSTAAINALQAELVDLNAATLAGAQNTAGILEQLQAIRDFGAELISAGFSADSAVAQMQQYRQQLLNQATAFGFNSSQLQALVEQVGLSDTALADFLRQIRDFGNTVAGAQPGQPAGTTDPGGIQQPVVYQTVNLTVPYGDPSAVGLAVANKAAYEALRW